jgi:hypothetical protein
MDSVQKGLKLYGVTTTPGMMRRVVSLSEPQMTTLEKMRLLLRIREERIDVLKKEINLDKLNKSMVRGLAGRLTGSDQHIKFYGRMTRDQLTRELVERGFQQ